jgi:hypothetical protein
LAFSFEPRCQGECGSQKKIGISSAADLVVPGHLGALVPGDRAQQRRRKVTHPLHDGGQQRLRVMNGKVEQPDRPCLAFHQRPNGGAVFLADDHISLPMPCLGPVLWCEGSVADRAHGLGEAWAATLEFLLGTPVVPSGPQRRAMLRGHLRRSRQLETRLVEGLVEALVTQPHAGLVRIERSQMPCDLLGAPALPQLLTNEVPQSGVGLQTTPVEPGPTSTALRWASKGR